MGLKDSRGVPVSTADRESLEGYERAAGLLHGYFNDPLAAIDATLARDPSFFLAQCQLAYTHDQLYFIGGDHTPARRALAEAAIEAAFRLRPDAGFGEVSSI